MGFIDSRANIHDSAYVHESAYLYGDITIAEGASVWINAAARAEAYDIHIGRYSNIQDFVMIHIGSGCGTRVGEYCSITHHVTLHGCTIGDNCLIGINSTIMDGCVIGDNCIIAGHTFLKEGTVIPDNSIVMGSPGEVRRQRDNRIANRVNALAYHHNARAYAKGDHRAWEDMALFQRLAREVAEDGR
ncbi:gamma carbonic anhydrase family protein [Alloalcanivorax xenomutans]|uniref:gamma carbonic anhydrase family protein n=1 Tax=Alloalcanivorax xenomutans TaxID=1094342 RepID=UPI0009B5E0B0|nr:gamma carbonic anhydrase family protein [Alloalcanivorax xenomutans]ARB44329.1 transferase [Alloalcanivorax xenomutans]